MVSIQNGWGLSPAVQWNHRIASADSERRAGSAAGWRLYLYTRFYCHFFFLPFSVTSASVRHVMATQHILTLLNESSNLDFSSFTLTKK